MIIPAWLFYALLGLSLLPAVALILGVVIALAIFFASIERDPQQNAEINPLLR